MRPILVCLTVGFASCITSCQRQPVQEIAPETGESGNPWQRPGTTAAEDIIGPDGGTMVWVPPGEFMMGCDDDDAEDDEKPAHLVKITKGFWLGRCEVTNAQYRKFCEATDREFPSESDQGDDHPVVYVSWEDAVAYCEHYGLRLPTEAEWEYAAAGPEGRKYPWGDEWDDKKCCNRKNKGPGGTTFAVGSFPQGASWCGALDMAGNVAEWCSDWSAADYYAKSPEVDPHGPSEGEADVIASLSPMTLHHQRVLRGGSWRGVDLRLFRCPYRDDLPPAFRDHTRGFRCAGGL